MTMRKTLKYKFLDENVKVAVVEAEEDVETRDEDVQYNSSQRNAGMQRILISVMKVKALALNTFRDHSP